MPDKPILLNDGQIQQFICDGFLLLEPDVESSVHQLIDERFNWLVENEPNPGNNILPRLPELEQILNCAVVQGAMISLLGDDYLIHPHRYWHSRAPDNESYSDNDIQEEVKKASHQDSYTPSEQAKSHQLQYLRFMYYSHDMQFENGPTHVIPGSQYHANLTDDDRERQIPVLGKAGTIFISHFDLGHAGCPNMSTRCRNMIKFIFLRSSQPTSPSWQHSSPEWKTPLEQNAPFILENCWQHQWNWLCGHSPKAINSDRLTSLLPLLNTGEQADRTNAIYAIAELGEPAIIPLVERLIEAGQYIAENDLPFQKSTIAMDDACYALSAIGEDCIDFVLPLLSSEYEWTVLNAIHILNDIGINRDDVRRALEPLLESDSCTKICHSANALGSIHAKQSVPLLCRLLDKSYDLEIDNLWNWPTDWNIHFNVAMALARIGKDTADSEDEIIRHHKHAFGQAGWFLTETLMRIGTPAALKAVATDLSVRRWDATLTKERSF
ncbi:phytanoyl-CoA dioxygenase family protein [bacterium AH-315-E10]|nr:phytanoyl-CoA dioxygenase family protein [bacterium AH-315-E10]